MPKSNAHRSIEARKVLAKGTLASYKFSYPVLEGSSPPARLQEHIPRVVPLGSAWEVAQTYLDEIVYDNTLPGMRLKLIQHVGGNTFRAVVMNGPYTGGLCEVEHK